MNMQFSRAVFLLIVSGIVWTSDPAYAVAGVKASKPISEPMFSALQEFVFSRGALTGLQQTGLTLMPLQSYAKSAHCALALGPLAEALPADLPERVEAARSSPQAAAALVEMIAAAHRAALPSALSQFDAQARDAFALVDDSPGALEKLDDAVDRLKSYEI